MTQQSRASTRSTASFPTTNALRERARRTRWLAAMTSDAATRAELVVYADELDRRVDAAGEIGPAPAAESGAGDNRREAR